MNLVDYFAISPLLILFATALVLILLETFFSSKWLSFTMYTGLFLALYAACISPTATSSFLTPWLKFDPLARFFSLFFISIGILCSLIASPFFKQFQQARAEFYFFLLSSLFGLILISSSNDFLTLFLGLETLSIALYVLCGYVKKWTISHEAAFKYFLLGSISTSLLLFGIAMVYGATGTTRFDLLPTTTSPLFLSGIALISLSLLFKAAVVPFHIWAPDVYAGAPSPVTAFMAVGTKAGAFAALIRIFLVTFTSFNPMWHQIIAYLAVPTLIYANFVAMRQTQLRRFFAYSGISHAGFLLIALASSAPNATNAMLFYLVVYTIATLGAFAVLSFIDDTSEGVTLDSLKGLFYASPLKAAILTLCLLTLGGIPPSVGFFAKFYVLQVGFQAGYYGLVIVGLLTTIFAAYYYLRIVAVMISEKQEIVKAEIRSYSALTASLFASITLIALSFYPEPLFSLMTSISMRS